MSGKPLSVDAMLRKAESLAKKRDLSRAIDLYAAVLERFPENRRALDGLKSAKSLRSGGQPTARGADADQEKLRELVALYNAGRNAEVLRLGAELAGQFPATPLVPNVLGAACTAMGRLEDAAAWYGKAAALQPDRAEAHSNLGMVLKALGRNEEAIASLDRALRIRPDFAELRVNLGSVLNAAGRHEAALSNLDRAIETKPDLAVAHNNRATALSALGREAEAIASLTRAVELAPEYAEAHFNLGSILMTTGRLEEAADAFAKTLRLEPRHVLAHLNLGLVRKFRPDDPHIGQLRELAADRSMSEDDRIALGFALGKAYDDIGDVGAAFQSFREANRLKKAQLGYDRGRDAGLFRLIRSIFETAEPQGSAQTLPPRDDAPSPLFVVGMPRSGTTLVEQILASHSRVRSGGELPLMEEITRPILREASDTGGFRLTRDATLNIRDSYLKGLRAVPGASPYVTDKTPRNFRWIGFILAAMPATRIVHLRREPAATCWSIFKLSFANHRHGYAYDLADIAAYYNLYLDLMDFWHERFPGRILDVRYESLTEAPEREIRRILEYSGLDWEPGCLDFQNSGNVVKTASLAQVRRGLYQGSSQAWRKYEAHLQPLLRALAR